MLTQEIEKFLNHLKLFIRASNHTVRSYATDLEIFQKFIAHKFPKIATIERKHIREFLLFQKDQNLSKRSLARRLASLRSFFRFCMKDGYFSQNPMDHIDTPKLERKVPNILTYDQVEAFFGLPDIKTYFGYRDRTILELFYSSGLRVSELSGLNRADFDLDELLLRVRGKGNKERIIPMTQTAARWINGYLTHSERFLQTSDHMKELDPEAIFLNKFGNRLSTRSIDRLFAHYLRLSGFAVHITPHIIRHTIATHWLEQGMDLKTIQLLLGHSSMATTTIYTEVSLTLKKQTIDSLHPRANVTT